MLDKLKEYLKSFTIKILFAFLVISFVLSGAFSMMDKSRQQRLVALVGNKEITLMDLKRKTSQLAYEMQSRSSENITTAQLKNSGIESRALQELINQALLVNLANQYDVNFSKEKLIDRTYENKQFYDENGNFNPKIYEMFKKALGYNDLQYLEEIKSILKSELLQKSIILNSHTPSLFDNYLKEYLNEKINFTLYKINIDEQAKTKTYSNKELKDIYYKHKSNLILPEKRQIELAILSPRDIKKSIKVTNEEIKEYYEDNISEYFEPKKFTFTDLKFSSYAEAEEFLNSLKQNNFEVAIRKYFNQAPSKFKYTDLDVTLISKGLLDNLDKLNKNGISDIVKLGEIYHIVQLVGKKESYTIPLKSVRKEITEEIKENKLSGLMEQNLEAIEENMNEEVDISSLAEAHNMQYMQLKLENNDKSKSALTKNLPDNFNVYNLISNIFTRQEGETVFEKQEPYEKGIVIAKINNIIQPRQGEFEEVKDNVKEIALRERGEEKLQNLIYVKEGSYKNKAKRLGIVSSDLSLLRYNAWEGLPELPDELLQSLINTKAGGFTNIVTSEKEDNKTLYVARVNSLNQAKSKDKISDENIKKQSQNYQNNLLMRQLYEYLRQEIPVEIYQHNFNYHYK